MFDLTYKARINEDKLKESLKKELDGISITHPIPTAIGPYGKVSQGWMYTFENSLGSVIPIVNEKEVTLEVRIKHVIDIPPEFKDIIERYKFELIDTKYH